MMPVGWQSSGLGKEVIICVTCWERKSNSALCQQGCAVAGGSSLQKCDALVKPINLRKEQNIYINENPRQVPDTVVRLRADYEGG
jgi:hypothetical protein